MAAPYDLVCLSHLRWDFVYQRPQHLLSRWAKERRVFFIEEPVFDEGPARLEVSTRQNGVRVAVPRLPGGLDEDEVDATLRALVDDLLDDREIRDYILWYYTPMAMAFTRHLEPAAVVYDCMDELSLFAYAPPALREREAELFARADLVFTGGQSLYEAKRRQHRNVHLFPSSVDVTHFGRARERLEEPADQASIARPRLGYFGVIDERMDLDLLAGLAEARPNWQLVMIGPLAKIDESALPRRANIHYLGAKAYADLPAYLAGWDVALLPFARNDSTRFISPTKTPEYLAAGKPVVSTTIRDVVQPYGEQGLVHIADAVPDFVAAVEAAMAEDPAARLPNVDRFLAQMSWERTWAQMKELVEQVVAARAGHDGPASAATVASRPTAAVSAALAAATATTAATDGPAVRGGADRAFDYLVVGAGYAGSVLAERLASQADKRVLVVDRRNHIGGNAYDHYDDDGILVHKYGPHIFHTNSIEVFQYLSQFTEWRPYQHRVLASVDGRLLPIPINLDTINELYGLNLTSFQLEEFFASVAEPRETIRTSEDVVVSKVGRELYEKFFRNYTRKQWGIDPADLDASVTSRVPTRTNRDDRYFTDRYQSMPLHGYTRMFEKMLSHPNIKIMLNTDYREIAGIIPYREMVYTGPIDEFFDCRYGKLPYRSLEFKFETVNTPVYQPAPVVNFPNEYAYTRVTEFKYLTGQEHAKTSLVYEFPQAEGDPYYPVPRPENAELYKRYKALADVMEGVYFVGRLATYKYYNMDQVVAQALAVFDRIIGARGATTGDAAGDLQRSPLSVAPTLGGNGARAESVGR